MITNPKNPISNLNQRRGARRSSPATCATGAKCPGAKIAGPIDLVDRVASSGTQDAFQNIFLGETLKISPSAEAEESNGLVQNKVKTDENAIGFVSFAFTERRQRRRLPGHPLHAAERQVRPVPGRA